MADFIRFRRQGRPPRGKRGSASVYLDEAGAFKSVGEDGTLGDLGGAGGGSGPFVGVDPPASPSDGELWWDTDDETPIDNSSPVNVVRQSVPYSAFVDSIVNPGQYRFAPVHTLAEGDVLLRIGIVCTETFDDSNAGSLSIQATDDGNGALLNALTSGGVKNETTNGIPIVAMEGINDDVTPWTVTGAFPTSMGLMAGAVTIGVCDNGTLAGDGAAGSFLVVIEYVPAP